MSKFTRRAFVVLRSALAAVGLLFMLITFTPFDSWYATRLAGPWNAPRGDVLVVLSASGGPEGLLSRDSYLRAMYAVLVWREGHFRTVLVCGRDAGPQMRDFLIFSGVPAGSIILEGNSTSTHENALFAAPILRREGGKALLLTSDYHVFRAYSTFRKLGLQVESSPIPDVRKYAFQRFQRVPLSIDLADETLKIVYYRWKGWI